MKKGQSTLEYAMVILALVGALIIMQNYVARGMQGRLRNLGDELGQQYDPGGAQSSFTTTQTGTTTTVTTTTDEGTTTDTTSDITETRSGTENMGG